MGTAPAAWGQKKATPGYGTQHLLFCNRAAARRAKRMLLGWNPQRAIIAHGECIRDNAREVLERSLAWMG